MFTEGLPVVRYFSDAELQEVEGVALQSLEIDRIAGNGFLPHCWCLSDVVECFIKRRLFESEGNFTPTSSEAPIRMQS